jgi:REP element-mobilizing transposase RayT
MRGIRVRQGAYLPHWTRNNSIYAVTFRLADSLPREVLERWLLERKAIVDRAAFNGRDLSAEELERLDELHSQKIESYLDSGAGACHLRNPRAAEIVRAALAHFDGERYELPAWCVMPNHVHAVLKPCAPHELPAILHSWKSFTANAINRELGLEGALWQPESYDHLIRDEADLAHAIRYVLENPTRAGLKDWPWVGNSPEKVP